MINELETKLMLRPYKLFAVSETIHTCAKNKKAVPLHAMEAFEE
jgi:hypothetical protein